MTVKELIKELKTYPKNWKVIAAFQRPGLAHIEDVCSLHQNGYCVQLNLDSLEKEIQRDVARETKRSKK